MNKSLFSSDIFTLVTDPPCANSTPLQKSISSQTRFGKIKFHKFRKIQLVGDFPQDLSVFLPNLILVHADYKHNSSDIVLIILSL